MDDYNKLMKQLEAFKAMQGEQQEIPLRPEEEMTPAIDTSAKNELIQEPTTPELRQLATPERDVAMAMPEPEIQEANKEIKSPHLKTKEEKQGLDVNQKYLDLIKRYESELDAPKKERSWEDSLPDALAGLHNILNYGSGSQQKMMKMDHLKNLEAREAASSKARADKVSNLNKILESYKKATSGQEMTPYEKAKLAQADKDRISKEKIAKLTRKSKSPLVTEGDKTLDREFAKQYSDWTTGGKADYEVNSKIFKDAIKDLKKGTVSTGTVSGVGSRIPGVRTTTRETEDQVRKAINGMLRATLGAQFTEKEGERIFAQTFDPFKSEEANIAAMESELAKIEKRKDLIEEMSNYYSKNKTLSGYQASPAKTGFFEQNKDSTIEKYAKDQGIDYNKAERILKSRGYSKK